MTDQERKTGARRGADEEAGKRRPYKAPEVVEYGSIARLTHSGGSTVKEGSVPAMNKGCL